MVIPRYSGALRSASNSFNSSATDRLLLPAPDAEAERLGLERLLAGDADAGSDESAQPRWRQHPVSRPTVGVVLPAKNEAQTIGHVLERIPGWVDEIVLIDGASGDGTIGAALAARPSIKVVEQASTGKGGALLEGFKEATTEVIVMLDADGSTDPADIPRFVAALRTGADLAKGTRFVAGGGSSDLTRIRRLGNRALVSLVNSMWSVRHSDLCYGYMAFWRRCLPELNLDCDGFEIETQIVLRFLRANLPRGRGAELRSVTNGGHEQSQGVE